MEQQSKRRLARDAAHGGAWKLRGRAILALAGVAIALVTVAATAPAPAPDRHLAWARWLPAVHGKLTPAKGLGAVTGGWGDAWMDDRWGGRLLRLDGSDGRVLARIPVDGRIALSAGAGAVWALQAGGGYGRGLRGPLLRIDPGANRVTARIPLRTPAGRLVLGFGVLADDGSIWVWGPMDVLRIDPRANRVVQGFVVAPTRGELTGAALADGQLIATTADGHLVRFDAGTGANDALTAGAETAAELRAATARRLVLTARGMLLASDRFSGRIVWRRRLGFRIGAVLVNGRVLLAHGASLGDPGDRLWAIDADTGHVLNSVVLPALGTAGIAAVDGRLWVTSSGGRVIVIAPWLLRRLQSD
jgi:hypothetical protein